MGSIVPISAVAVLARGDADAYIRTPEHGHARKRKRAHSGGLRDEGGPSPSSWGPSVAAPRRKRHSPPAGAK